MTKIYKLSGFTLIELMITVAIVGILAAIAYPSYQQHVLKSWRINAAACLSEMNMKMERRHTGTFSYATAASPDPLLTSGCAAEGDMPNRYTYAHGVTPNATTFEIRATPQGAQAQDPCKTLSINQLGQKNVIGAISPYNTTTCWQR